MSASGIDGHAGDGEPPGIAAGDRPGGAPDPDGLLALFDHVPGAVVSVDGAARITAMNRAALTLFERVEDSALGDNLSSLFNDPREFKRVERGRLSDKAPEDTAPFLTRYRSASGRVFDGETVIAKSGGGRHIFYIRDATEGLKLRARLESSEVQLRTALASARQGAYGFNLETGLGSVRGFICDFLGIDKADATMSLESWRAHVDPDHTDAFDAWLDRVRAAPDQGHDLVYPATNAAGELRWLENRGRVTEVGREGEPKRIAGVVSDVTDRKALEDRLAENERLLREGMEAAGQGAWSLDFNSGELTVSGILLYLQDRREDDRGGHTVTMEDWLAPLSPQSRELALSAVDELRAGSELVHEYEAVGPDGQWIWLLSRGRPVEWDEDGRLLRATGVVTDITETKRLEALADERAVRLREALDATGEGAWTFDLRTGVGQVTRVVSEMMGLGSGDATITVDQWAEGVHVDDIEIARSALDDLREGRSDTLHYVIRFRDAKKGWIRLLNRGRVSRRDPNGRPVAATGFMSDITERLETEERLDERERQLEDALGAALLSVWRVDASTRKVRLDGPIVELIGEAGADEGLTIESWKDFIHPDDREAELETVKAMAESSSEQQRHEIVYRLRSKDGRWLWHRAIGRVIRRGEDGAPLVASGVLQDVHDWKRLSDLVESEKRRFESIYRSTPAMLHTINAKRQIIEVSDYWLTYLGYERDEVIGRFAVDFVDEETRDRLMQRIEDDPALDGAISQEPMRVRKKNGEYIDVLLSAFSAKAADGSPVRYGVMSDVSALREAYGLLERSNRELDRFATVASHDLQEPLRKISAFSGLLHRRYRDALDEDGSNALEFLADAAQRMQKLIDDLLTYSRMSSRPLEPQATALSDIVDEACEFLETAIADSGARIDIGDLPDITADRSQLRHMLQNLLSNAIKYRGEAAPRVTVSAETDEAGCTLCVADNGIGLDPRFSEKIFAPFQRLHTRDEFPGTGIGLAIVQQAAERHGGRVWVESAPGEGARFFAFLPQPPSN